MLRTLSRLVLDGSADGAVGITLGILRAAARSVSASLPGAARVARRSPGTHGARRTLAVGGALSLHSLGRRDVLDGREATTT